MSIQGCNLSLLWQNWPYCPPYWCVKANPKALLSPGNTEAEPKTLITLQLMNILHVRLPFHLLKNCHFFTVGGQLHTPIVIALAVNGKDLQMELDTGAAISIISKATKEALFPEVTLHQSDIAL